MKLEKLVLNGFKSFADKTEFDFDRNITAIVGPNGCGKSNVVDGIKWVLGNQSPKSLRSGQMTDVIFSGSSSRKPSGMAEVSLRFSGVSGMDFDDDMLEITRRIYKNGDSTYLMNNKMCRLKDIREMFMDTGVGVSAYSIIEQGQIDQLLHASKQDRRVIFEEAAGISKYKAHKKEALRKLDRTEQNLLRLADIVAEVQKQLRSIKLQAGKARNYLEYSERLKELRVNYSLSEYHKIISQTTKKNEKLSAHRDKFGEVAAKVARNDANVSELGKEIMETEIEINRWDNSLVASKSRIEQQLERIEFLKARIAELLERKETATSLISKLTEQSADLNEELSSCQNAIAENETLFDNKNAQLEEMQAILAEINHDCNDIGASLQDEKSGIIDIVRRTAHLHNEIQSMSTYRDRMSDQKERLSGKADAAKQQLEGMLTQKAQYSAKFDEINGIITQLQESLDGKRGEMAAIDSNQARANEQLAGMKEKRSAVNSELKVLSDMEAKREGLSKSLKAILLETAQNQDEHDHIEGIVADIVNADAEYATAIEAALEGKTDALIVNSTARFLADTDLRRRLEGRVNVLCMDRISPFVDTENMSGHPAVIGRAVEFINYESRFATLAWSLLGHTLIVDSIDSAVKLSRSLGSQYSFVTVAGEVFNGENCFVVGPVGKASGLISRRSRMHQLENELAATSHQMTGIEAQMVENNQQIEHLSRLCKDLRTAIYEANTEKVDTESKLRIAEENVRRLKDEQPVITSEIEMLEQEISQSVQKEYESKEKLEELEAINEQRNTHIEQLEAQLAEKREMQETQAIILTELKVEIGQIAEQRRSIRQRTASLQSQLQHGRIALESARTDLLGCDDQVAETERNILTSESTISELYVEKEKAQTQSLTLHEKVSVMREEKDGCEEQLRRDRAEQAELEQMMHQVELDLSQLSVKNEDLTLRVMEELGLNLAEEYEHFEQEEVDWDLVRQEINDLRGKIERLGNVNVDAIKELDELEQRFEFLTNQVEDLNKSKSQLEQLIARINKESKEKFRVTFEEVRKNFQELFRKLFGGGKADILLEDPEDILESGIEIVAKPPGKELRSISLLSGGEKTMTCMGLLFAVFRSKPSPFCILDEVDAALDEANNERFNMIVQEFQKNSQFVIITHAKRTMSIAEVLFGVTMQTKGVSKKISVKFDSVDSPDEIDSAVA